MLRAALVDAGGTLWPDNWPRSVWAAEARRRLRGRFGISDSKAVTLLAELARRDPDSNPPPLTQDSLALIGDALEASGLRHLRASDVLDALDLTEDPEKVRRVLEELVDEFEFEPPIKDRLRERPKVLGVTQLTDVTQVIRVTAETVPSNRVDLERQLRERIGRKIAERGIQTPYARRDEPP